MDAKRHGRPGHRIASDSHEIQRSTFLTVEEVQCEKVTNWHFIVSLCRNLGAYGCESPGCRTGTIRLTMEDALDLRRGSALERS